MRFILPLLFLLTSSTFAQNTYSVTVLDHDSGEPIAGASVYFPGLQKGNVTDATGKATVKNIPDGIFTIEISFLGYETFGYARAFPLADAFKNETVELELDHEEFEEIVVQSTRSSRTIEDIPTRIEFIAGEELSEKGNMKPGDIRMLLNESTGIRTQQTSATSYNSSIRIQGLDGKYTQLLRDGLPLYSGYSGGLSLMQIAPLDLKQVEVIKSASSTLYGGGAIAGIVNLITITPDNEPELSFMVNGTSALGLDLSGFYSARNQKIGTTVFTSYNHGTPYDPADIGLTAIPKFDRVTVNPKVFFYLSEQTQLITGFNFVSELREGGNIELLKGNEQQDSHYFESNDTDRFSTQIQLNHSINNSMEMEFKNTFSYFDREIQVPTYTFSGTQFSSFSELNMSRVSQDYEWIAGINLWTESFDQSIPSDVEQLDFNESTVGIFAQNTSNLSPKWTLESGLRFDVHSEYGAFLLPRISLMYEADSDLTYRLGGGLGYKTPTVFNEDAERIQFRNIRPLDPSLLDAERSLGINFDVNRNFVLGDELTLSLNTLLFYTRIEQPLQLRIRDNEAAFVQTDGNVRSQGMEVNMKWAYDHFKLFIGYTFADVVQEEDGVSSEFPLVAKGRLNNVLMYEKHGEFWIGLEAYFFSPQQLTDGSEGQAYWIAGLMTEKVIREGFSIFLNFENFLDTRQTAFDTIFTGSIDNPQFRDIYAPVDGFVINGGFKLKF
ncbi:MAG: TonB-dependent receptor [Balneolaceae bacterium]|nr:TonB-dependent receptor [Balneolaceae bacterium]